MRISDWSSDVCSSDLLPEELKPGTGLHYNPYFANLNLAMVPPLTKGQVTYADGTEASVDQMAKDVTAFLVWTAEPKLIKRIQVGYAVFFFLLIFTEIGRASCWGRVCQYVSISGVAVQLKK